MKKAFSLVELMIVVAILGILAAIILPGFQSHTTQARDVAAKENLRILRGAIELYAAQHNGIAPGYPGGDVTAPPSPLTFVWQLCGVTNESGQTGEPGTPGFNFGPYLRTIAKNPFNDNWALLMIGNSEQFPAEATGAFAWVYQPATKTIKLDWPGTDSQGGRYYDY